MAIAIIENVNFEMVTAENFEAVCIKATAEGLIGLDIETDTEIVPVFLQIYLPSEHKSYIFDLRNEYTSALKNHMASWKAVGHNLWYDLTHLYKVYGVFPTAAFDTFLLSCSLQEEDKSLKGLIKAFFGWETSKWDVVFADNPDYVTMSDKQMNYIANDPYYAFLLLDHYKNGGQLAFVERAHAIDMGAFPRYLVASVDGLEVDRDKFGLLLEEYRANFVGLQAELDAYAGKPVRVSSTKDLKELLFDQMGLTPPPITTPTGAISVSKQALSYVHDKDGIISLITEIKETKSVLSSSETLPELLDSANKLHPEYRIVGFDGTSRVYSTKPSIGQYPRIIRDSFIPSKGKKFLYMDWKAAELLIAATWAKSAELLEHYESEDLYAGIAQTILDKEDIDKSERDAIKIVVLSILFGSEGGAASRALHISQEEAGKMVEKFLQSYPEFARFQKTAYAFYQRGGYTSTAFLRPRILKQGYTAEEERSTFRQAVNTAIQGTCADLQKMAIASLSDTDPKFVTTVFDSFLFEVDEDYSESEAVAFLSRISSMSQFKLRFEWAFGDSWGACQKSCA